MVMTNLKYETMEVHISFPLFSRLLSLPEAVGQVAVGQVSLSKK